MKKFSKAVIVTAILAAGTSPAAAFFGFTFGMNSQGPFIMMSDGNGTTHFNMYHPFGSYRSNYYRGPFAGPGVFNPYFTNPYRPYGANGRWPISPYSRFGRWQMPYYGSPAWRSYPWGSWGGYRPGLISPWGAGMPYGGMSPISSAFPVTPFSMW